MSPFPRLIPCLDLIDGRVVKGIRFEAVSAVADPVERASDYESQGATSSSSSTSRPRRAGGTPT
ncbi:Histidine biosynthesis domain protein [mine drainage metagenome]|uniref:Histidine biosynthesis domain protein n=1 Tax=mine drainage metagenome TaxID=410659 RepID=T1B590_9ZZZZ